MLIGEYKEENKQRSHILTYQDGRWEQSLPCWDTALQLNANQTEKNHPVFVFISILEWEQIIYIQ
jgi:hypothetical protein